MERNGTLSATFFVGRVGPRCGIPLTATKLRHESSAPARRIRLVVVVVVFVTVPETFRPQNSTRRTKFLCARPPWTAIFIFQFKVFNALSIIYVRMHDMELNPIRTHLPWTVFPAGHCACTWRWHSIRAPHIAAPLDSPAHPIVHLKRQRGTNMWVYE